MAPAPRWEQHVPRRRPARRMPRVGARARDAPLSPPDRQRPWLRAPSRWLDPTQQQRAMRRRPGLAPCRAVPAIRRGSQGHAAPRGLGSASPAPDARPAALLAFGACSAGSPAQSRSRRPGAHGWPRPPVRRRLVRAPLRERTAAPHSPRAPPAPGSWQAGVRWRVAAVRIATGSAKSAACGPARRARVRQPRPV